ncbi:MAG TPA: ACP S-malonyltransferase [Chitinophagales bacterium]|nr:ACP S-malonyltransferase [Chitinophagales bacterium]
MKAYVFPGQGSQFTGMGKELFDQSDIAKQMFAQADEILRFSLSNIMFTGTDEELKQTKVTQPAVFLHSVIAAALIDGFKPDMVAGHSLGEFSALVANKTLSFEDALKLVSVRALAMQRACELVPGTMAAVLNYESEAQIENICAEITGEVVVAANYNAPGQLVISGSVAGIDQAMEKIKAAGVRKVIKLPLGGAFHSPLMEPARKELAEAIYATTFSAPICPVYQNVSAKAETDPNTIKENLIAQLTSPVRWTQSVKQMLADGATEFTEVGPGVVLQGLIKKIRG